MAAGRTPTPEQQAIIDAYCTGADMVIEAGAGTGKTTTLKMLAAAKPNRDGLYLAYNKAIANEAKREFPRNVDCRTAHSLAFRSVGIPYAHRLKSPRLTARDIARILRINDPVPVSIGWLAPQQVARLAMLTIKYFCRSADREPSRWHVPRQPGLDSEEDMAILREAIPPLAQRAWADITDHHGHLRFEHDHYLKMYQLTDPVLPYAYAMLDEAQDANPVIAAIIGRQTHAQRAMVGDQNQQIYAWNGAVDAMAKFQVQYRLRLTQSFRFGPAVAEEANRWLAFLGSTMRLSGFHRINSAIETVEFPDAILCRTNSEAMKQAISAVEAGQRVALVGGGNELRSMARAAIDLKNGRGTDHPELFAFQTWAQLQDYVDNDPAGEELEGFVKMIDDYGAEEIIDLLDRLVHDDYAQLRISTTHKAKGLEWDSVKIAPDFRAPKPKEDGSDGEVPDAEKMLIYVGVTRAKLVLDRNSLAWADERLAAVA
jgi:AAA domain-containing protein/UvrD-like helicase family protein